MIRRILFRAKLAVACFAAALPLLWGSPAHAQAPSADDAVLFEMRSGQYRLGNGVRGYQLPGGVCVDFADIIMALDLPVRLDKNIGRASGWLFDESQPFLIDREDKLLRYAGREQALPADAIVDAPEGWCIKVSLLSQWLGVKLTPDTNNALLLLGSDRKLPFQEGIERRQRAASIKPQRQFDLTTLPQAKEPYSMWRTPSVDVVASVGGIHDSQRGTQIDYSYEIFASGEIAQTSFDARLSSDNDGVPASLRLRAYRADPQGKLLGPLRATYAAIGDVSGASTSLGVMPRSGRGFVITNRPLDQPDSFDSTSFRGNLPEGWDAELYRNGILIGFANTRADGRYEFLDVPLQYGPNRFEVVLYGPQGQIRRETSNVPVGLNSIPPERTWYWMSANQEGHDLVALRNYPTVQQGGWRASFGLERGIDRRTSLHGSVHTLTRDGNRYSIIEGGVRRAIGPALAEVSFGYELNGGWAVRAQILGQLGNTNFNLESIFARDFVSDRVDPGVRSQHIASVDHYFGVGGTVIPVHFDLRYIDREGSADRLEATARASYSFGRVMVTGQLDWKFNQPDINGDSQDELFANLLLNGSVGKVRLRGAARFRIMPDSRFESAEITGEWRWGERGLMRAQVGYDKDFNRFRGGIGYSRTFDRFAITGTVEAATDGSVAAGVNLSFSFAPDPANGGFRMSSTKLATGGQVSARVFRDLNGDGIRQENEPLEPEVQLAAGNAPVRDLTNDRGMTMIEGLTPYRPVLIGVDAGSIADPLVQPTGPGKVVTPRPGIAISIDLPLSSAGEIQGILRSADGRDLPGVDLELVDVEGRVAKGVRSEFDGFFIFEGVPYGRYTIRIAKPAADAVKAETDLGHAAVVNGDQPSVRLGNVVAKPRGGAFATRPQQ